MTKKYIHKILSVVQTEGLRGTSERIRKLTLTLFGLRISETLCYRFSFDSNSKLENIIIHESIKRLEIKIFSNLDEFRNFSNLPIKMKFLPVEEWFFGGATCLSLISDLKMVAYAWLHPKQYYIENMGTLFLKEQELFFGPAFTDKKLRRKGLYQLLILNSLKFGKKNEIKHIYSSSSIENTPSIKGLIRYKFKVVGCVRSKDGKNKEILEFNRENLISQRLQ